MSQVVRHTKSIKRIHKKLKVIAIFLRENISLIQQGLTMSQDPPPAYSEKGQGKLMVLFQTTYKLFPHWFSTHWLSNRIKVNFVNFGWYFRTANNDLSRFVEYLSSISFFLERLIYVYIFHVIHNVVNYGGPMRTMSQCKQYKGTRL